LCEFKDRKYVDIGGRLMSFWHGYIVEDEKRSGIEKRSKFWQRISAIG
jgi:hypothetical protein